jgi:hypothetical protein
MDPVTLVFYAIICGALALFSPAFPTAIYRLLAGAVVGLGAASLLPFIRASFGL